MFDPIGEDGTSKPLLVIVLAALLVLSGCAGTAPDGDDSNADGAAGDLPTSAAEVAQERGLSQDDIYAALKTYMPTGEKDEAIMFASGGHSGQVLVVGVPSMRILKVIGVFTPEPWQGYGFGGDHAINDAGETVDGEQLRWGDTHHPGLSETDGEYDGEYLFINDKSNARVAVISLEDFETKQIVNNPNARSDHGATFVTPNTEYIIEGPQYPSPGPGEYAPLSEYNEEYRGYMTFWKFDRQAGEIDQSESFQIELPPYWQDLCDAGKAASDGWIFCNSFNSERHTGAGDADSEKEPFEAGTAKDNTDFFHIINWEKAAELAESGTGTTKNGMQILPIETLTEENVLYFTPEPKSPHGVDVTPNGEHMVVSGKLDPHTSVYSFDKIQQAIQAGTDKTDPYGIPILPMDETLEKQVKVGLGPLHTVYDDKGYAYTSLFLDSAVAKWSLGGELGEQNPTDAWALEQTTPVHYNVGHMTALEGDTASPEGEYVMALNKWSIDRFANVGPLLPQNLQLIGIDGPTSEMSLLYDMPIGIGEPHYAQIIEADKLDPMEVYPEKGFNPETMQVDPDAPTSAEETRVERDGDTVEIWMTAVRSHFSPEKVTVQEGDHVIWHLTNIEQTRDATHGFELSGYNLQESLEPGETRTFEFNATEPGVYSYYCTEFCSALHLEMTGYFLVEPAES